MKTTEIKLFTSTGTKSVLKVASERTDDKQYQADRPSAPDWWLKKIISLIHSAEAAASAVRGKASLDLTFDEPWGNTFGDTPAITTEELQVFVEAFLEVYPKGIDDSPRMHDLKPVLHELLQEYKRLVHPPYPRLADTPRIVNEIERMLGTPIFVKLLEKATRQKNDHAVRLINSLLSSEVNKKREGQEAIASDDFQKEEFCIPEVCMSK